MLFFGFLWILSRNVAENLASRNIQHGFAFLMNAAGFEIGESMIPFQSSDTLLRAFGIGILNTLKVSVLAIFSSLLLGIVIAFMKLSRQPVLHALGWAHVEFYRNIPLIIGLLAIYLTITEMLPDMETVMNSSAPVMLDKAGLQFPVPLHNGMALLAAAAVGLIAGEAARRVTLRKSTFLVAWGIAFGVFCVTAIAVWLLSGAVFGWAHPHLEGFVVEGGGALSPEFLALWLGLTLFSSAPIAEVIRAGILSVGEGQWLAGEALANYRQKFSLTEVAARFYLGSAAREPVHESHEEFVARRRGRLSGCCLHREYLDQHDGAGARDDLPHHARVSRAESRHVRDHESHQCPVLPGGGGEMKRFSLNPEALRTPAGAASAAFTFAALIALLWGVWRFIDWGVINAVFQPDYEACHASDGACWGFVAEKWRMIIFGRFPYEEQWRPAVGTAVIVLMLVLTAVPKFWSRRGVRVLGAAWVAAFAVFFSLMYGGVFGLSPVDPDSWGGLPLTVILTLIGMTLSSPLGILLAIGRRSKLPLVRTLSTAYIELVRGVPLITVLFVAAFIFPILLPMGFETSTFWRVATAIVLFQAAYMAETVRGGLQAVPAAQMSAAESLGLSRFQCYVHVLLPQALVAIIPAFVNSLLSTFMDTSLVTVVSMYDLLGSLRLALGDPEWREFFGVGYLFVGAIYFASSLMMSAYSQWLEKRMKTGRENSGSGL